MIILVRSLCFLMGDGYGKLSSLLEFHRCSYPKFRSTFYHFQWDLNYSNPAVFRAMAAEMLYLANIGVDFFRMDAVAFMWKRINTTCESLPEVHKLLRAFNALCRIAAPSVLFKSEAIVHPDQVVSYIDSYECQLSYNPLQMALTWEVRRSFLDTSCGAY